MVEVLVLVVLGQVVVDLDQVSDQVVLGLVGLDHQASDLVDRLVDHQVVGQVGRLVAVDPHLLGLAVQVEVVHFDHFVLVRDLVVQDFYLTE